VVILKRQQLIDYRGERSQEKMGNMYGVTQQSWSKWERGTASPSLAVMKKIEIDSGISMEVIFFDSFNNLKLLTTRNPKAS
jgi:transcriptional regulator with XRE-family HTH domain